jgi:hypothetical protein
MAKATHTTKEEVKDTVVETPETVEMKEEGVDKKDEKKEKEVIAAKIAEPLESDEILFLRHLMNVQHSGGWGKHLDHIILERIATLKG